MNSRTISGFAACLFPLAVVLAAAGQPRPISQPQPRTDAPPASTTPPPAEPGATAPPQDVPVQVRIGMRVDALRRSVAVAPTVVVVSTPAQYVQAVSMWNLQRRFPVLIDDGSDRAREDIARFVRAFEPTSVLRWTPDAAPLPDDPAARREAVDRAMFTTWGATSMSELIGVWGRANWQPPGVVVASPNDPAWTAALALAAGRGQVIAWVDTTPAPLGNTTAMENVTRLSTGVTARLDELKLAWRDAGDQIEAVTLCLSTQTRVAGPKGPLALTDVVGRHDDGKRWAWAGIIPGSESVAAYRAMCALFLLPTRAWLFDGYKEGFAAPYALPQAAKVLEEVQFTVTANYPPAGGVRQWRQRARFGVDSDLIHVNTSGGSGWFDLTPGRAYASDLPLLIRPAIVHFIHSYSAQSPAEPGTLAARWLDNGAYAFYGSMDEPFLGAFFPAEAWLSRFLGGAPLGVAVRQDTQPPWKLNLFGDPLIHVGGPLKRHQGTLDLPGAVGVDAAMQASLKDKDLAAGAAGLVLLGRDDQAVKLAKAALGATPPVATAGLARVTLLPAVRQRDRDLFLALYAIAEPDVQRDPVIADALWTFVADDVPTTTDDKLLAWLRTTVRGPSMAEDAALLAPAFKRVFGDQAASSLVGALLERAPDDATRNKLRELGQKY